MSGHKTTDVKKGGERSDAQAARPRVAQAAFRQAARAPHSRREFCSTVLKAGAVVVGAPVLFAACKDDEKGNSSDAGADGGTVYLPGCDYDEANTHFALLGKDEKAVLGPSGHLMIGVDTDYHEIDPKATVKFQTKLEGDVYSDGDPANSAVEYVFDANNRQLTISFPDEESNMVMQAITFCGIEEGKAIFETDYVDGFLQCEHINITETPIYSEVVNGNVTEALAVTTATLGFSPTGSVHEDVCNDLGLVTRIVEQTADFDAALGAGSVPEEVLSNLSFAEVVENQVGLRTFMIESVEGASMRAVEPIETVKLTHGVPHAVDGTELVLITEMVDTVLDFDAAHGGVPVSVDPVSGHTHIRRINTGEGTFRVKFENPDGNNVTATIYKEADRVTLQNGSFTVGEVTYNSTLTTDGGITSVQLVNPDAQ